MRMSFVGAGKVGTTLGIYFQQHGFQIQGYYSRSIASAEQAANRTDSKVFHHLEEVLNDSDIVWLTVNDDALSQVDQEIARIIECMDMPNVINMLLFIHTSGVHTATHLKSLTSLGLKTYSVHPLQAFKTVEASLLSLPDTTFTIEGNGDLSDIENIFKQTNNHYRSIESQAKVLYHAGACVFSNYLVALMNSGFDFFEKAGFERVEIYQSVAPLIVGTLENIKHTDPRNALTGPIQRGDVGTVSVHLKAIQEQLPSEEGFYKAMGLKTIEMLKGQQETAVTLNMKALLKGE